MDIDLVAIEREICRIPEVRAARIVADSDGQPVEVHVLATPGKHAKQLARDVQSVAMASVGLEIDHRIISVVQLDDGGTNAPSPPSSPPPAAAAQETAPAAEAAEAAEARQPPDGSGQTAAPSAPGPTAADSGPVATSNGGGERTAPAEHPAPIAIDAARILVDGIVTERRGVSCTAHVTLRRGDRLAEGVVEGPGAAQTTARLVAEATLDALRHLEPAAAMAHVETATITKVGDREVAVTTVVLVVPPNEELMTGSAPVRGGDGHGAMARSVLDATNRRLAQLRSR